jgi:hypothetical protein
LQFENQSNYNCEIQLESGETYRVFANWLHNNELDHWQGWNCNTGVTRLHIDKNFKVFNGECGVQELGHALDGFELVETTVCTRTRCIGCTDDLVTKKHAPK